jgi:PKD domain-containing protein
MFVLVGRRRLQANRVVVATVAAGAVLALAGAAAAGPTWSAPVRIGAGYEPRVAVNPAGDAAVGFLAGSLTEAIWRPRGAGAWTGPTTLAEGGSTPNLALDEAGDAFAVFTKGQWPSQHFQASYRSGAGETWADATTLSSAEPTMGGEIAVDPRGDAVATFTRWTGTGFVIQSAVRPASGTWQQAVDLSDQNGNSPRGAGVAIDTAGNAVALWVRAGPVADNPVLVSAFRPVGGPWTAPVELAGPYGDVWDMHARFDAAGNAIAVWEARSGGDYGLFSSYRTMGGTWTGPTTVAAPNIPVTGDLGLTVDAAGDALAVWTTGAQVAAAARPASTGRWQQPTFVSAAVDGVTDAALAGDRSGNAVAVWTGGVGDATVHAALRPAASGAWEPPVDIASRFGSAVDVAMDEQGGALAVWQELPQAGSPGVHASELTPAGPVLAQLSLPAAAAGVPATFRVTPAAWDSPLVGEPLWDFGDGGSARGAIVRHTYRQTGSYTVDLSQSDAAGRSSRSTATIVVARATLRNRSRPAIRGTPRVGATITCLPGTWSGSQPIRLRYAWLAGARRVGTGTRHRVRPADIGSLLSCRVTATNGPLTRAATSRPIRIRG